MRSPAGLLAATALGTTLLLTGCSGQPSAAPRASATTAWTADLGGAVVGRPAVADGRILAATEGNRVVALDPADGAVLWSRTVGTPLTGTASAAGCGNLDPLGITSAPVVDRTTHTVYVVAEVRTGSSSVEHRLVGLDDRTGRVVRQERADPPLPPGESAVHLLQRPALVLANDRVYAAYGGNSGDCGRYHGWVVGIDVRGSADEVSFEVAADGQGGAIWMSGGAPAVGRDGDLYVTTGNANPDPPAGGPDRRRYTESVVRLSPALAPLASFKDPVAGGDEDLSTGPPLLLPDGRVLAVGKTDVAYLLDGRDLHRVGAIAHVCGSDPDGTPAYDEATKRVLVPCRSGGLQVLDLAHDRLGRLIPGPNATPVLAGGRAWAASYDDGTLTAVDVGTASVTATVPIGTPLPHFATPAVGAGLVLIGTTRGVTAMRESIGR